jgi:hypothetical protein
MTAYVVLMRESTKDKTELATYAQMAPAASQGHQFVRTAGQRTKRKKCRAEQNAE